MLKTWKDFLKEEEGMGTVEIILIIVVLISLVIIFKAVDLPLPIPPVIAINLFIVLFCVKPTLSKVTFSKKRNA